MHTNVSTLLREFPKVRQAAMRGERVIIHTREGNLVLAAESIPGPILGGLKGQIHSRDFDLTTPTTLESEWIK